MSSERLRGLAAVLLIASAGLFAVGALIERHDVRAENHAQAPAAAAAAGESGESAAKHAAEGGGETPAQHAAEHNSERIFGVDTESIPLIIAFVALSLLLAWSLWSRGDVSLILLGAGAFALVAAVFDVREVVHQIDESREGLAVVAGAVAILHLTVAAVLAAVLRGTAA